MGSATRHTANALASIKAEREALREQGPFNCYGCDSERAIGYAYCPSCDEPTEGYQWDGVDPFAVAKAILAA